MEHWLRTLANENLMNHKPIKPTAQNYDLKGRRNSSVQIFKETIKGTVNAHDILFINLKHNHDKCAK